MSINNGFSKNILNIIKEKNIKPKPRWQFLLKNYIVWSIGVITLIVGGLAFSVIIYLLRHDDWSVYNQITGSVWEFIFLTLPYFWLFIMAAFIFVVYYNIKHTKKGYRYPLPIIITVSILLSAMLGVLFFKVGLGQAIDDVLGERAPFYSKIFNRRPRLWIQPDEGRLAGLIISQASETEYILLDPQGREWNIITGEAKIKPFFEIQVGRPIELIGEKLSKNIFKAERIMPVGPGRKFFMRRKNRHFPGPGQTGNKMMRDRMGRDLGFQKRPEEFLRMLEKYPELKEAFVEGLLERRERIKEIIENDPEFIKNLKKINIPPEIIEELRGE